MKRFYRLSLILAMVALLAVLCGCASDKSATYGREQRFNLSASDGDNADYTIDIPSDRKLEYSAYLTLYVDSINDTVQTLDDKAKSESIGGYVGGRSMRSDYADLEYRIPVEKLTEFLNFADNNGEVNYYSIYAEDVTDAYYTAKARCVYLQICMEDLEKLLNEATTVTDKASIKTELAKIAEDLAKYEKQSNEYETNVTYSRVSISLYQNSTYHEPTFIERLSETLFGSAESVGEFFKGLAIVLVAILPYALIAAVGFGVYVLIKLAVCKAKGIKFTLFENARLRHAYKRKRRQEFKSKMQQDLHSDTEDKQ